MSNLDSLWDDVSHKIWVDNMGAVHYDSYFEKQWEAGGGSLERLCACVDDNIDDADGIDWRGVQNDYEEISSLKEPNMKTARQYAVELAGDLERRHPLVPEERLWIEEKILESQDKLIEAICEDRDDRGLAAMGAAALREWWREQKETRNI